jgi:hypothetical protein
MQYGTFKTHINTKRRRKKWNFRRYNPRDWIKLTTDNFKNKCALVSLFCDTKASWRIVHWKLQIPLLPPNSSFTHSLSTRPFSIPVIAGALSVTIHVTFNWKLCVFSSKFSLLQKMSSRTAVSCMGNNLVITKVQLQPWIHIASRAVPNICTFIHLKNLPEVFKTRP